MAYRKTKDIVGATGEYQDASGTMKKRWENVGAMLTDETGKSFILMKRCINLSGFAPSTRGDPSMVAFALFDPQDNRYGSQQPPATPEQQAQRTMPPARPPNGGTLTDDDVPF